MTHTLHRRGVKGNLGEDAIVFAMSAKGFNEEESAPRMRRFLEIILRHDPVNFGDMKTGNRFAKTVDEILRGVQNTSIVHGVFTDWGKVPRILEEIKEADLGMSVVVTGLFDEVEKCCRASELSRHTIEHSLGVMGRMELLPEDDIVEITTMCGHGMVPANLVRAMVMKIKQQEITPEAAGIELAKPCHCGVFNNQRAERLLRRLVATFCVDQR